MALICAWMCILGGAISRPVEGSPPGSSEDSTAPPARIGRLSFIEGTVSFQPAGADEWAAAEPNRPVTSGDRLWADTDGRAEVEIGSAAVRLSHESEVDFVRLDDAWTQIRLPQGTLAERVNDLGGDQDSEIDTPNAAISLGTDGNYRVDVSPDGGTTTITVWSGKVEVTSGGSSFAVEAGQVATIMGDESPTYNLADAGSPDEFDQWSQARDEKVERPGPTRRYVSENTPGAWELDTYGNWEDSRFGPIWYPTAVEVGWAPYRWGHWAWVTPWGWTWVDSSPWGFAPYHYGRWAYVGNRWGWCPGRVVVHPVYAPALVVFLGVPGLHVSLSLGGGSSVAWFPLAPEEVYRPAYATDVDYRRRINYTNVTNITNITNVTNVTNVTYHNRGVADAVTAVPQKSFMDGHRVDREVMRVPPHEVESARVVGTAAPVAPTPASLAPARAHALPPHGLATRAVVATHAPPPAPVPFASQEKALRENPGKPVHPKQLGAMQPAQPSEQAPVGRFRPAAAPVEEDRRLKPAHPASPSSAGNPGMHAGSYTPASSGREPAPPARSAPPPAQPPHESRPSPKPVAAPHTPLDQSYQTERAQVEARHRQEFVRPPGGEPPAALNQRQEAEHRDLLQRYHQAQAKGMSSLPPPKPPQHPAPKGKPKQPPQH